MSRSDAANSAKSVSRELVRRYMPRSQRDERTPRQDSNHGKLAVMKTVLIPALISLAIYIILSYLVLPFLRHHRHRYNHYLPLNTISAQTTSIRHRLADALYSFFLPSSWSHDRLHTVAHGSSQLDDEDSLFDDEEGEGMIGFEIDSRRRGALERRRSGLADGERRLSRDLEEGFRDDSEEEVDEEGEGTATEEDVASTR